MTQLSKNTGLQTSSLNYALKYQNEQSINPHVITLITFLALLPLVYFIPDIVERFLPNIKWPIVTITVGVIVPIISYVVMSLARLILCRNL